MDNIYLNDKYIIFWYIKKSLHDSFRIILSFNYEDNIKNIKDLFKNFPSNNINKYW